MKFFKTVGLSPEFMRFIIVGGINTLASYIIYVALLLFLSYPVAYTLAYVIAIFISYYLNTTFVFKRKASLSKALQFPLVYVVQYLAGFFWLYLLIEVLGINQFIAPILVVGLNIPVTYLMSKFIIKGRLPVRQ